VGAEAGDQEAEGGAVTGPAREELLWPRDEAGFTLIEMLVAMTMGVVVMGGVLILLIGAMRSQPKLENQGTNIQTARWVLERMTREIRNGIVIDKETASSVSFQTYVRHTTCGGTTTLASTAAPTRCEVTYTCSGEACTRLEALPGVYTGTATRIFRGLGNPASVFTWSPEKIPTYIGVTLEIPDSQGSGGLTASDGASLRNATLGY
jgi:prepilin-type N-terminal cleavage/methylation domain-containing protein